MADNPVSGLKRAVEDHAAAAIGTHGRIATEAGRIGERVIQAGRGAADTVRRWWNDDGRGPRRTADIRLPTERRQTRRRR